MLSPVTSSRLYSTAVYQRMGFIYDPYNRSAPWCAIHDVILKMLVTGDLPQDFATTCCTTRVLACGMHAALPIYNCCTSCTRCGYHNDHCQIKCVALVASNMCSNDIPSIRVYMLTILSIAHVDVCIATAWIIFLILCPH